MTAYRSFALRASRVTDGIQTVMAGASGRDLLISRKNWHAAVRSRPKIPNAAPNDVAMPPDEKRSDRCHP
jgi:hypothetical protein